MFSESWPRVLVADDDSSIRQLLRTIIRRERMDVEPVVLVISAYADQRVRGVDPSVVAGILRKPFEVADLGGIVSLCIHGLDRELFVDESAVSEGASAPN